MASELEARIIGDFAKDIASKLGGSAVIARSANGSSGQGLPEACRLHANRHRDPDPRGGDACSTPPSWCRGPSGRAQPARTDRPTL